MFFVATVFVAGSNQQCCNKSQNKNSFHNNGSMF
jgi:hypothetical protein